MLKNAVPNFFIVLAVLTSAFVTISFVERSNPSKTGSSWPARPVIIPLLGNADLSDYFLRHSERSTEVASAGIPLTGANDLSDYHQRFKAMKSAVMVIDTSDYFVRHPASSSENNVVDTSDYFLRH